MNKEEYFRIRKRSIYLLRAWTVFIFFLLLAFSVNVWVLNKGIIHFKDDLSNCIVFTMLVLLSCFGLPVIGTSWFGGLDKI